MQVTANSTKDLSNVVLLFCDGTTQKYEGLSGTVGTFQGTESSAGKCIVGIWIKSGCNQSDDGPGYGEYVANGSVPADCCVEQNNENSEEEEQNEDNINGTVPVRPRPGTGGNGDRKPGGRTEPPIKPGGGR
jgi:hypothetical protein